MKRLLTTLLTVTFIMFGLGIADLEAQDMEDDKTTYWYVSEWKIPPQKLDSLRTLIDKSKSVYEKAIEEGPLLEHMELIHDTGGTFTYVRMMKYPSWEAINEGPGFGKVAEEAMPDSSKRQKIINGFQWILNGASHKDNIYTEATHSK